MPFRDGGEPLAEIHLVQVLDEQARFGRLFTVAKSFTYSDEVHPEQIRIEEGRTTDLASVPDIFWAFIASYGRQSPAAILHDQECARVEKLPVDQHIAARVPVDEMFQRALRSEGVPLLRSHLMWTFVSLQSYFQPAPRTARAIIGSVIAAALLAYLGLAAIVVGIVLLPAAAGGAVLVAGVVAVLVPGLVYLIWRTRIARLIRSLLLVAIFLGPIMGLQWVIVALFRLVEKIARRWDPIKAPVDRPTLQKYTIG